jgi:alpha-mannosidase
MKRRRFTKLLGLGALAGTRIAQAQNTGGVTTPTLYYVDGYHGGVRGHMPAGSWRDILNTLRAVPQWKLCLDIEPASWDVLRRQDPSAYREIQRMLSRPKVDGRLEMVNGTFAQPFGWANGGESNIRQIARGREVILEHFPDTVLETYAVQEPCWSSCLPQILRSFGFNAAVLKNPSTAWGGYAAGFDAEIVNWIGPDGSSIPAVPRYACEELLKVWETESVTGSAEFSRKCAANGIQKPSGMCFQDLGWAAKPRVSAEHIRFVTWREYIQTVAEKPVKDWRFTMEDILTTLPWGEKTIQAAAQQVRSAENRLLLAEKAAALAWMTSGQEWPVKALREAWDDLLWAQHHDAWITVTTRSGRRAWAFQVGAGTLHAEEQANAITETSMEALAKGRPGESPAGAQWVRVVNTLAVERRDLAELTVATDRGARGVRVLDAAGRDVTCQVIASRRYGAAPFATGRAQGPSLNTATVLFRPTVPALGYASYKVDPVFDEPPSPTATTTATSANDGSVTMESDLYRLRFDPRRGGALVSLFSKELNKEFCEPSSERLFNEYRGYFIAQKQWRSSTEETARVSVMENGPLRARVRISGRVGGCPFQTTVTLAEGQAPIDFQTRFTFDEETWIGDPWDIKPEARRTERRRSQNDGRWKLQAFFPVSLANQSIYKNAAYDVCRSRNSDTFFQGWHEIKHNILLHWVDVVDESQGAGLAVFSDHTTAYTHGPQHPLALVLGWGWEGGFWWGKCPLKGVQQMSYAVVPHKGRWDEARISQWNNRWNEPLLTQLVEGPPLESGHGSQVTVSGGGVEVPTLLVEGTNLLVRLFNAEGDGRERTISFATEPSRVELVELDGRAVQRLNVRKSNEGRYEVKLAMPRFAIRTLRCAMRT